MTETTQIIEKSRPGKFLIFSASVLLFFASCVQNNKKNNGSKNETPLSSQTEYLQVDSASLAYVDTAMLEEIAPYKAYVDSVMNKQLAFSDREIFKKKPNGLLNNLSADMVLEQTRKQLGKVEYYPDFCLLNYGGLRHPLPKGVITLSDIYQLMPFSNEVVVLKLSGLQVDSLFRYVAATGGQPLAGCTVEIKDGNFVQAFIGGKKFDKNKDYYVLTSDYLANGGDRMSFFKHPEAIYKTGLLLRNAMIDYVKERGERGEHIVADPAERIKIIE